MSRINGQDNRPSATDGPDLLLLSVQDRVKENEEQGAALSQEVGSMQDRLSGLDRGLSEAIQKMRASVSGLGESLEAHLQKALGEHTRKTEVRFAQFESEREANAQRAALLEREVAGIRQQLAAVNDTLAYAQEAASRQSGQLREDLLDTDRRLREVAASNHRPRDRFEVRRGETAEIAPNIRLHISKVELSHRRFHGWLHLADQGKILWLRDQSVLQAVSFYAGENALRHDIVATDLNSGGIVGYLIYPRLGDTAEGGVAAVAEQGQRFAKSAGE